MPQGSPNLGNPNYSGTQVSSGVFTCAGATFHDSGCAENPTTVPVDAVDGGSPGISNNQSTYGGVVGSTMTDNTVAAPLKTHILMAIDGPSPNVNSGLLYANSPGTGPFTDDGLTSDESGTGAGLALAGIAASTYADATVTTTPATTTVPQLDQEVAGIHSNIAVPAGIPTATLFGVATEGTGLDQLQQNATTTPVVTNPVVVASDLLAIDGSSPNTNAGLPAATAGQARVGSGIGAGLTDTNLAGIVEPLDGSSPNTNSGLPATLAVGNVTTSTTLEGQGPA
jgi:hypothetical protein